MLERYLNEIYVKFKLNFYRQIFARFEERETSLTVLETFCAEVIHALGSPTVNEFAQFSNISAQNATHKVNNLVRKGYVTKLRSPDDKREFILSVTDKFFQYYNLSASYVHEVIGRIEKRFTAGELSAFERALEILNSELMPEVVLRGSNL
jgi:DNA-binding MarR family transcriptional regulator